MTPVLLQIYELAGWGFDPEADRTQLDANAIQFAAQKAEAYLHRRAPYKPASPCLGHKQSNLQALLADRAESVASSDEFDGFNWKLAVIDLRRLVAFQRRLGFDKKRRITIPDPEDSEALLDIALPRRRLEPGDPSPYMEVAFYRDRWFLRDGYHRSYDLLRCGITCAPTVVLHARTIEELGASGHKFYSEDVLFSAKPPMVCDFGNEALTVSYFRQESAVEASNRYPRISS
ncbi:MAG TPA: hypothetical protein VFB43_16165 [Terracidiphilus sp.]|nr:hypothetical protein [Terracidiphilus sp.]